MSIVNPSNLRVLEDLLDNFLPYAKEKLGYENNPSIRFAKDPDNARNPLGKTGYYEPDHNRITVYIDGRHPKDIMRSVSHELVHHAQNLRGDLAGTQGVGEQGYAQNNDHLREMEREAYEQGNLCFRDWEDGIKSENPNMYESLKRNLKESQFAATASEEAQKINAETGIHLNTDQEYWERSGIRTGEELAIEILTGTYNDMYKSVYGFRPRHSFSSVEDVQAAIEALDDERDGLDFDADEDYRKNQEIIASLMPNEMDVEYEKMPKRSGMGRAAMQEELNMFDKRNVKLNQRLMESFGYKLAESHDGPKQGDDVVVTAGGLAGAAGEVMELTTSTQGEPAVVIYLRKDADQQVMGKAGDEVIALASDVEVDRGIQDYDDSDNPEDDYNWVGHRAHYQEGYGRQWRRHGEDKYFDDYNDRNQILANQHWRQCLADAEEHVAAGTVDQERLQKDEAYKMAVEDEMKRRSKQQGLTEGSMAEYGKIDAEDGNPPSKIGQGNSEYMKAYNSVLMARGEEPLPIAEPDQAYLDALRSGKLEENLAVGDKVTEISSGKSGAIVEVPQEDGYWGRTYVVQWEDGSEYEVEEKYIEALQQDRNNLEEGGGEMPRMESGPGGVEIFIPGLGTMSEQGGAPIYLEKNGGSWQLYVWSDISSEDPTHKIDLSKAVDSGGLQEARQDFMGSDEEKEMMSKMSAKDHYKYVTQDRGRREMSPEEINAIESFNNWLNDKSVHPFEREARKSTWEPAQSYRGGRVLAYNKKEGTWLDVMSDMPVSDEEMSDILPEAKLQNALKAKLTEVFARYPQLASNKDFINTIKEGVKNKIMENKNMKKLNKDFGTLVAEGLFKVLKERGYDPGSLFDDPMDPTLDDDYEEEYGLESSSEEEKINQLMADLGLEGEPAYADDAEAGAAAMADMEDDADLGRRPEEDELDEAMGEPSIESLIDLMQNDQEFKLLQPFVDKFARYTKSGGSIVSSLEAALPDYVPGKLIQSLISKAQGGAQVMKEEDDLSFTDLMNKYAKDGDVEIARDNDGTLMAYVDGKTLDRMKYHDGATMSNMELSIVPNQDGTISIYSQEHADESGIYESNDEDGDGDVDSDDYMAKKDKAIKKAMGKEDDDKKEESLDYGWNDKRNTNLNEALMRWAIK